MRLIVKIFCLAFLLSLFVSNYYSYSQNLLKAVDIRYKVMDRDPSANLDYVKMIPYSETDGHELFKWI